MVSFVVSKKKTNLSSSRNRGNHGAFEVIAEAGGKLPLEPASVKTDSQRRFVRFGERPKGSERRTAPTRCP
jgi:hypothetical protein